MEITLTIFLINQAVWLIGLGILYSLHLGSKKSPEDILYEKFWGIRKED